MDACSFSRQDRNMTTHSGKLMKRLLPVLLLFVALRCWAADAPSETINLPAPVLAGQQALAHRLEGAEAARVLCEHGGVGMLVVGAPSQRRLVDLFPLTQSSLEISPDEPTMK